MSKYLVTGYYTTPWNIEVEANDPDEAYDLAYDAMLLSGEGVEGEGEWLDEFDVEEVVENE
jgi:hypothetical protein